MGGREQGSGSARLDTTVAHPARRYDYWLGGKDNFAADRESGDAIAAAFPAIRVAVLENRRFLRRAVAFLAGQQGIRQFLDVGTGIPTSPNVHEVAQAIAPTARVVYVDDDPVVLAHARALLVSAPQGATAYVDADLRDPERVLNEAQRTLDFTQPVALLLIATMHFIPDGDDPYGIMARLVADLPSGSYLVMSHATRDYLPPNLVADIAAGRHGAGKLRSRAEIAQFFDGLELMTPGIVPVGQWRAEDEPDPRPTPAETAVYAALAHIA